MPTYARADVTFVRGEGARLWDAEGREYLDFGGGIAVVSLGHRHPAPLEAAHEQLDRLWHASNLYRTEPAEALAARLSERFGGAQAFFCNSGAEAIEAALKYARKATGKAGVVALEGSFHGRTFGALSATGQPAKRAAFEPLVPGVRFVAPNDVDALTRGRRRRGRADPPRADPRRGRGRAARRGVRRRRGRAAAAPRARRDPDRSRAHRDVLRVRAARSAARSRGAGEGLGERPSDRRLLVADEAAGAFEPGDHGSTFGGNPVSCAAACAVVDSIDDELLAGVREQGRLLARRVRGASRESSRCVAAGSSSVPSSIAPPPRS